MKEPFLQYGDYKSKLPEWQEGAEFNPNIESDERCKKFLINSVDNDSILRKMLMLGFIKDGILSNDIANIYIMRRMING